MSNNIVFGLIFFGALYLYSKKKKKLTPEEIAAIEAENIKKEEERKKAEAIKEEERKERARVRAGQVPSRLGFWNMQKESSVVKVLFSTLKEI